MTELSLFGVYRTGSTSWEQSWALTSNLPTVAFSDGAAINTNLTTVGAMYNLPITSLVNVSASSYTVVNELGLDVDTSSGNVTINLPDATLQSGQMLYINKFISTSNSIIIDGFGAQTIDGNATKTLVSGENGFIISDGSNWISITMNPVKDPSYNAEYVLAYNSATQNYGSMYMTGNLTFTTINTTNVYVKAVGNTTAGSINNFTHSGTNRLTYNGTNSVICKVSTNCSVLSDFGVRTMSIKIAVNGVVTSESSMDFCEVANYHSLGLNILTTLSTNDYVELFIGNNESDDDILVSDMTLSIVGVY